MRPARSAADKLFDRALAPVVDRQRKSAFENIPGDRLAHQPQPDVAHAHRYLLNPSRRSDESLKDPVAEQSSSRRQSQSVRPTFDQTVGLEPAQPTTVTRPHILTAAG